MSSSGFPHSNSSPTSPPADSRPWPADPLDRAAAAAAAGLRRPVPTGMAAALELLVAGDADPRVRTAALGALARLPDPPTDAWRLAAGDADPALRRRAGDLAPAFAGSGEIADGLLVLLEDAEAAVAEAAAWALGELGIEEVGPDAVGRLSEVVRSHGDPLVREAAVAALGALGDPGGLEAVLAACGDKPAIRRRAVLALAAFEGPDVDAALQAALADKDWQTRQAAEDLLD